MWFLSYCCFVPWRIVDTPLSVASEPRVNSEEKDNVVLTLKLNDDQVWMNDQPIRFADQARFQALIAEHSEGIFIIKAEEGVTLQTLMHLADRLKLNGAKIVSIANAFAMPEIK